MCRAPQRRAQHVARECIAQRHSAHRSQFGDEPIRQRTDGIILVICGLLALVVLAQNPKGGADIVCPESWSEAESKRWSTIRTS